MSTVTAELTVRRPVYQQDEINHLCKYAKPRRALREEVSKRCKRIQPLSLLRSTVPLIGWLPSYDWRGNVLGDIVAGITVAVMHIPQGMAYAILGNVPPIVGIYMAFFPVLVYLFLGTSRHNSMGTFALICMMTGKVVLSHSSLHDPANGNLTTGFDLQTSGPIYSTPVQYSPIEVATAVTFTVAIIQLAMYVMRLGLISSLLTDSLVSGFTTAAAVHVFTSQIKDLLGLGQLARHKGFFKLIFIYVDIFQNFENINEAAVIISGITVIVLLFNNEVLKPRIAKISPFPIPIEMLTVVIGTVISIQMSLSSVYGIVTVGDIPVGLPSPSMPPVSLVPDILVDCLVITMVSYTISMSMALIFAQEEGYEVDSNQELVAQGLGNLLGSFFSCMPFTASLSRSLVQKTVGGHTQLASLVSCVILVSVLLWIGPFFEPLPRCILASIIVVALKGMLLKVTDFRKFWILDKAEAAVWAITFATVILLDVEYGLLVGIVLCLGRLVLVAVRPYTCRLALAPGTELYLDTKRYKGTVELPGVKIFRYSGSLNFACRQRFRDEVYKVAELVPVKELNRRTRPESKLVEVENIKKLRVLILDLSAMNYLDLTGVTTLKTTIKEFNDVQVPVYITGCSGPVYETIRKSGLLVSKGNDRLFAMFPSVADAVHYAKCNNDAPTWSTTACIYEENCISRL